MIILYSSYKNGGIIMQNKYAKLFECVTINKMTLKNRFGSF